MRAVFGVPDTHGRRKGRRRKCRKRKKAGKSVEERLGEKQERRMRRQTDKNYLRKKDRGGGQKQQKIKEQLTVTFKYRQPTNCFIRTI